MRTEDESNPRSSSPITFPSRELPQNSRIIIGSNFTNLRVAILVLAGILGILSMFFFGDLLSDLFGAGSLSLVEFLPVYLGYLDAFLVWTKKTILR